MRKFVFQFSQLLLSFILMHSCGTSVKKQGDGLSSASDSSLSASYVIVGEIEGSNLIFTYNHARLLEKELANFLKIDSVSHLNILAAAGNYWLSGLGDSKEDSMRYNFAILLNERVGQNLVIHKDSSTTQYCSAKKCCSDCDLQIMSEKLGKCDCIHNTCLKPNEKSRCVHKVLSKQSAKEFNAMIDRLLAI